MPGVACRARPVDGLSDTVQPQAGLAISMQDVAFVLLRELQVWRGMPEDRTVLLSQARQHHCACRVCSFCYVRCRYRMDYLKFVEYHRTEKADITVGCLPVDYNRASDFGLMNIDPKGRITVSTSLPHSPAATNAM